MLGAKGPLDMTIHSLRATPTYIQTCGFQKMYQIAVPKAVAGGGGVPQVHVHPPLKKKTKKQKQLFPL